MNILKDLTNRLMFAIIYNIYLYTKLNEVYKYSMLYSFLSFFIYFFTKKGVIGGNISFLCFFFLSFLRDFEL